MIRVIPGLITLFVCLVLLAPAEALGAEEATEPALGTVPQCDVSTLLLASRILSLLQEDQAGLSTLLAELQASGDLTSAGAEKLEAWLNSAVADYTILLTPVGSLETSYSAQGQLPVAQPAKMETEVSGVGVELNTDGSVRVQGVEQLIGMVGLGPVAEAASTAGVVLELDPQNVGVYIPITIDGTVVSAGQTQFDGVDDRLKEMLRSLKPDARIYTVPKAWRANAGAAWGYLCELVTGKEVVPEPEVTELTETEDSVD